MKHGRSMLAIFIGISSLMLFLTGCERSCEDTYQKAMSFYQAGKYQKAVQLLELILTRYPDHNLTLKAQYQLGNIYFYKLNQPEQALNYAQKLYERSPQGKYSLKALQLIGYIYDKSLNRCLNGVDAYRLLIQDYSSEIDTGKYQMAIADCYFKLRKYPQAVIEYETLKDSLNPEYVDRAQFQIANSYALTEACEEAIKIYETLLQREGLSEQFIADVKLELAYCYSQNEEFSKALVLYGELEQQDSQDVSIDRDLIVRKKERALQRLAESNRKPLEVDWTRR